MRDIKVDLSKCYNEKCKCGNVLFRSVKIIKRIPALMTGSTNGDVFTPIDVLACAKCGYPHVSSVKFFTEPKPSPVLTVNNPKNPD